MTLDHLDQMTAYALEDLAAGNRDRLRTLVRRMSERWHNTPALMVSLALTSAAHELESQFRGPGIQDAAYLAYKFAALVAGDVLALETLGGRGVLARDLLLYWRRTDPYFLRDAEREAIG